MFDYVMLIRVKSAVTLYYVMLVRVKLARVDKGSERDIVKMSLLSGSATINKGTSKPLVDF